MLYFSNVFVLYDCVSQMTSNLLYRRVYIIDKSANIFFTLANIWSSMFLLISMNFYNLLHHYLFMLQKLYPQFPMSNELKRFSLHDLHLLYDDIIHICETFNNTCDGTIKRVLSCKNFTIITKHNKTKHLCGNTICKLLQNHHLSKHIDNAWMHKRNFYLNAF